MLEIFIMLFIHLFCAIGMGLLAMSAYKRLQALKKEIDKVSTSPDRYNNSVVTTGKAAVAIDILASACWLMCVIIDLAQL